MNKKTFAKAALGLTLFLGGAYSLEKSNPTNEDEVEGISMVPDVAMQPTHEALSEHHDVSIVVNDVSSLRESIASCLQLDLEEIPSFLIEGSNDWRLTKFMDDEECDNGADYKIWKERYDQLNEELLAKYKAMSESGELEAKMLGLFDKVKGQYGDDDTFILLKNTGLIQDGVETQQFVFSNGADGRAYNIQLYPVLNHIDPELHSGNGVRWKARIACIGNKCRVGEETNIIGDDIDQLSENLAVYLESL